jgi:hypothetical protein
MARKGPNIVVTGLSIAAGSVVGHVVGRALRPTIRKTLGLQAAEEAQAEVFENESFTLEFAPKEVLPGVAVALLIRSLLPGSGLTFFGAAFLGSATMTVIADTKYDKEVRSVLKKVAPGGSFLT